MYIRILPTPKDLARFEVELAELIAAHLRVKAEFAQGHWNKLPDILERGDVDIVLNGYEWTPNRSARYGLSIPYYIYELQLLGRVADDSLKSWHDLLKPVDGRPYKASVLGGTAAQDYIEQFGVGSVGLALFDGATDEMEATKLGLSNVDANLQDLPVWTFYSKGFARPRPVGPPVGWGYICRHDAKGGL